MSAAVPERRAVQTTPTTTTTTSPGRRRPSRGPADRGHPARSEGARPAAAPEVVRDQRRYKKNILDRATPLLPFDAIIDADASSPGATASHGASEASRGSQPTLERDDTTGESREPSPRRSRPSVEREETAGPAPRVDPASASSTAKIDPAAFVRKPPSRPVLDRGRPRRHRARGRRGLHVPEEQRAVDHRRRVRRCSGRRDGGCDAGRAAARCRRERASDRRCWHRWPTAHVATPVDAGREPTPPRDAGTRRDATTLVRPSADAGVATTARGTATLTIGADPWGEIYIDGKSAGRTPREIKVSAGRHTVEIVFPAETPPRKQTFAVELANGETKAVQADFK